MEKKKKYKARNGAGFSDDKAQIYGESIERMMTEKGGMVQPVDIVNAAEYHSSPFHDYFEWDNELASNKYRIWQARGLIAGIIQVTVKTNGAGIEQRAFLNVSVNKGEERVEPVYVTTERALTDVEFREQTLAKAIKEIQYWQRQYSDYAELADIFAAIEETVAVALRSS